MANSIAEIVKAILHDLLSVASHTHPQVKHRLCPVVDNGRSGRL